MLIFSRPEYDTPTRYTARWAKKLVDLARDKGYSPVDLGPKRANRKTIESFLRKRKAFFVMFNGHGGPDRVYGQDNEILVKTADNERLLRAVVVYSLTCNSARALGPSATKAGAAAYIGYRNNFWFTYKIGEISHPLSDKRAQPFFEASAANKQVRREARPSPASSAILHQSRGMALQSERLRSGTPVLVAPVEVFRSVIKKAHRS